MWPKLLMQYLPQLVELLPHVSRVVPAADKYLAQRGTSDAKLNSIATTVRDDLGRVARAHVDMATQLDAFAGQVLAISAETKLATAEASRARVAAESLAESVEARLTRTEHSIANLRTLLVTTLFLLAVVVTLLIVLLVHSH